MKIKFISRPDGQAPEWVRDAWIGLIVETPGTSNPNEGIMIGVQGGPIEDDDRNIGGYEVNTKEAVTALEKTNPEAALWWKENFPIEFLNTLVFGKEFCEIVSE